jgi:hypothetical protein
VQNPEQQNQKNNNQDNNDFFDAGWFHGSGKKIKSSLKNKDYRSRSRHAKNFTAGI